MLEPAENWPAGLIYYAKLRLCFEFWEVGALIAGVAALRAQRGEVFVAEVAKFIECEKCRATALDAGPESPKMAGNGSQVDLNA